MTTRQINFLLVILGITGLVFSYSMYQKNVTIPREKLLRDSTQATLDRQAAEQAEEKKINATKVRSHLLDMCVRAADKNYNEYLEFNMEKQDNGSYSGEAWKWTDVEKKLKDEKELCFKQYK